MTMRVFRSKESQQNQTFRCEKFVNQKTHIHTSFHIFHVFVFIILTVTNENREQCSFGTL